MGNKIDVTKYIYVMYVWHGINTSMSNRYVHAYIHNRVTESVDDHLHTIIRAKCPMTITFHQRWDPGWALQKIHVSLNR